MVRNDAICPADIRAMRPAALVLSPGPCTPNEAGSSLALVRELHQEMPILGVCLGHQTIGQALGGSIVRAREPVHGRCSLIAHHKRGLFEGVASPTVACRYHSLVIDPESLPDDLAVTAALDDGTIMAVEHRRFPVYGVQFHPESVLTADGYRLLANFLRLGGCGVPADLASLQTELPREQAAYRPPAAPVTF